MSGTGTLIEQNVIGSSATSYTLPVGSQTQDNVVLITGGGDITIEENLMGFARWRTILFLSPTIGCRDDAATTRSRAASMAWISRVSDSVRAEP